MNIGQKIIFRYEPSTIFQEILEYFGFRDNNLTGTVINFTDKKIYIEEDLTKKFYTIERLDDNYKLLLGKSELKQYQIDTSRTCPNLVDKFNFDSADTLHMSIGMVTEVQEIFSCINCINKNKFDIINLSEELADLMWYVSNYARIAELECYSNFEFIEGILPLEEKKDGVSYFDLILYYTGELLDLDKKKFAYSKQIQKEKQEELVSKILATISNIYFITVIDADLSLTNNINKLKVRYPDKFTEQSAIERDLNKERVELEKK